MSRNESFPLPAGGKSKAFQAMVLDADTMAEEYESHMSRILAPERVKKLRPFSSNEAAEILGLTPSNLRKLHSEGPLPKEMGRNSTRRLYTAQELLEMRQILAENSRNPRQFVPGRQEGEKLQVVSSVTFKGGSGKTTSCVHLAQRFALKGYRVLAIDMDPQASLSTMMGLRRDFDLEEEGTIYDALRHEYPEDKEAGTPAIERVPLSKVARPTYFPNLDLAPSGSILQEFEAETPAFMLKKKVKLEPFYTRLATAIAGVEHKYDLVFIDCPPHLGYLTLASLCASTSILVPVVPNMIDVASLKQFLRMASTFLNTLNGEGEVFSWDFLRYLLSRYEPTDAPQVQVSGFLRSTFPGRVMTNPFLKSTAIADAGITSDTVYEVDRSQMNRTTLLRALESINLVANELEEDLHRVWGRKT
jgi:chromosome partitioning protein